jgi:hypothetical protein
VNAFLILDMTFGYEGCDNISAKYYENFEQKLVGMAPVSFVPDQRDKDCSLPSKAKHYLLPLSKIANHNDDCFKNCLMIF